VYNKKLVSDQTIGAVKIWMNNSKLVANGAINALSNLRLFDNTLFAKGKKELQEPVWAASGDNSISNIDIELGAAVGDGLMEGDVEGDYDG